MEIERMTLSWRNWRDASRDFFVSGGRFDVSARAVPRGDTKATERQAVDESLLGGTLPPIMELVHQGTPVSIASSGVVIRMGRAWCVSCQLRKIIKNMFEPNEKNGRHEAAFSRLR